VGYFGHWVVVRGAGKMALRRLRLQPVAEECAPGWRYAYGSGVPRDLAALVVRAANAGDGVAVGAWVQDDNSAQVVAVSGGRLAALGIGRELALEPLAHDPDAFAHWSWCTPRPLSAADARRISGRAGALAEETVDELFDQLGLPAPYNPLGQLGMSVDDVHAAELGGYLAPLGFMLDELDGDQVVWPEIRHVPGLGQGFLGIWDREAPDEPVATFVVSRRGEARLREELGRLQPQLAAPARAPAAWFERFDRVDGTIAGERRAAAVFEGEDVVGVVIAAEHGHEGEAAAYLARPGDGIRLVYSLESIDSLTAMLERYLGEVELSEWIAVPEEAPADLAGLGPVVLALAGL
jgi:hypothetical protein